MREETTNWWKQALIDLETAEKTLEIGIYYTSVFYSQLAVEKGLKALYIEKNRRLPAHTHNLLTLGRAVNLPKELFRLLYDLNPEFFVTRYPDAANGVPAEMFDEESAHVHLDKARKVVE